MLLTADWHLTDSADDEYRWAVFDAVVHAISKHDDKRLFILGDLADRKDRHSSELVNRMVKQFKRLHYKIADLRTTIIMGNHDAPLKGTPYWNFLNELDMQIEFLTQPTHMGAGLMVLPYVPNPQEAWAELGLHRWKCLFMHQPVDGARGNNGHRLSIDNIPRFGEKQRIYSGDIHTPQKIGRVQYIGAPHPVDFGDSYKCRMLTLDQRYEIDGEIILHPPRKIIARVNSFNELVNMDISSRDQVQVQFTVPIRRVETWAAEESAIRDWASNHRIKIKSIETVIQVETDRDEQDAETGDLDDPVEVLCTFAEQEGLDEDMLIAGLDIIKADE